jgi:DNA repair protein RecO (recombination protein O)
MEPLVFARFRLYRSPRSLYLREVEPFEAFLPLRRSVPVLRTALGWCAEIASRLPPSSPCDELLGLLYWSLCLLVRGIDPPAADFRFAWRWLRLFGVAPDLLRCGLCGGVLSDGGWGEEGLLCPRCLAAGSTSPRVLGTSLLRDLRGIAMLSRERFAEWSEGRSFPPELSAQGCRIRSYFEGTP